MAIILLLAIYLGAWAGLSLADLAGVGDASRILWGFAGCWVAALLLVVGAAAGRTVRR